MNALRIEARRIKGFIEAAEAVAKNRRKVWSSTLKREVRKCWGDYEAMEDRIAAAVLLINDAKDLPPLPALTADDMLAALERAAVAQGLTPTLGLRADLRSAIANKPPPPVAHARVVEVFAKHAVMQNLQMIGETVH